MLNLPAVEILCSIDDNPGKRSAKIDELVHHEGYDAGGKDIVLHVGVPRGPETFSDIEMSIVFGNLVILAPVRRGRRGKEVCGIPEKRREKISVSEAS